MTLQTEVFSVFNKKWAILAAGNRKDYNAMTISWGGLGTLWFKPVVTVYVNPARYTYHYMEKNDYFTVSFFEEKYRKALAVMGERSGRDCDKTALAGLSALQIGNHISFAQAQMVILCKKIYYQDMLLDNMPKEEILTHYQKEKPHRMYIGEVLDIQHIT